MGPASPQLKTGLGKHSNVQDVWNRFDPLTLSLGLQCIETLSDPSPNPHPDIQLYGLPGRSTYRYTLAAQSRWQTAAW